jgi:hypothetical protein
LVLLHHLLQQHLGVVLRRTTLHLLKQLLVLSLHLSLVHSAEIRLHRLKLRVEALVETAVI